jgi:DNA-binding transcriptional MocR family regulator
MLYERVADRIESYVAKGIYEPGERLPSIRRLSGQFGVSINTVREACRLLENRRIAHGHAGSGYFVAHLPAGPGRDEASAPPTPQPVTVDEISYRVCEVVASPEFVNLSVAVPRSSLLPVRRLAHLHARALRRSPESCTGYNMSPGRYGLRQNIAKRLLDVGCAVSSQNRYGNFIRVRSAEYTPVIDVALATVGSIARALAEKTRPALEASVV